MNIPGYLQEAVHRFGETLGLESFALSERGTAGFAFASGLRVRFEYVWETLAVTMSVPAPSDDATMKRLLERAHPAARRPWRVRTAYLAKDGRAVFMTRVRENEATVPALQEIWNVLWREANEFGGAR